MNDSYFIVDDVNDQPLTGAQADRLREWYVYDLELNPRLIVETVATRGGTLTTIKPRFRNR